MLKKIILLFTFFISQYSLGQDFQWVKQIKGITTSYTDIIKSAAIDQYENTYTLGDTESILFDINPTLLGEEIIDNSNLNHQFRGTYLIKTNSEGDYVWGLTFGSYKGSDYSTDVKIGTDGYIYILLSLSEIVPSLNIINNSINIYKISPNGTIISNINIPQNYEFNGEYGNIYVDSFELDNQNNFFLSGYFTGRVDISSTINLNTNGINNYVLKINNNGNYAWIKQLNITDPNSSKLNIRPDNNINLLIKNNANYVLYNIDNLNNNIIWEKVFENQTQNNYHVSNNGIVILGKKWFSDTIDVDPSLNTFEFQIGSDFLIFLDLNGNFQDVKIFNDIPSNSFNFDAISTDINGKYHIIGFFDGIVDFDSSMNSFFLNSSDLGNTFYLVLDQNKNLENIKVFGSQPPNISCNMLTLKRIKIKNQNIYMFGNFISTCDFDPLITNQRILDSIAGSTIGVDGFFLKLGSCTNSIPFIQSPQNFCIQQNATINSIAITGQNIQWYDAPTNGNLLPNITTLVNGTTYYTSQTINGCESNRVPVSVQILNTPAPTGNANQSFCSTQNATVADIITNGTNVIWYNSATNTTPLANTTLLTNNTTYFAAQTINGCESVNRLAVTISLINTLNATNYAEVICDDLNDNIEIKNLTTYNSNLISSTGNTFKYYSDYNEAFLNSNQQITNFANYNLALGTNTFYVRIDSPNTCFQIVTLTLELVSKPIIPINDIEPLCEGKNITLNAGNNYDTYTWSTGEITQQITITQPGSYSVTVTENHGATTCTSTKNFTVVNSNIPTIQEIISSDWTENNNTITVLLQNNSQGDYEYSLNGIDFQNNPVFNNLEAGEYTIFVRDKNGCGMVSGELYLLMYPKFFTPNGDGYNDYWKIKFSEIEPNLTIKIFDRYGKLMKQLGTNSLGWDGKYLGKDVPSSDYWFIVTRENGKEYKGHFSLKR
jgi:gliding motility-associated-like protein